MLRDTEYFSENKKFNIVDVLLLDHKYLKECIRILKNERSLKAKKLKVGKSFLDAVKKHSHAEKKAVYAAVKPYKDLHHSVLEGECEHGIIDSKVKMLIPRLVHARALSEEMEVELEVIAEIIEHHIKEEEKEMLPKIRKDLDKSLQNEMGFQFMRLRDFSAKDLEHFPKLQEEVPAFKKMSARVSPSFITKVQEQAGSFEY